MKIREAAVAGMFYPDSPNRLSDLLDLIENQEYSKIKTSLKDKRIIGGVVPHAGYVYSGYEAIHFFKIVALSEMEFNTVAIIHPNHSGIGPDYATDVNEVWKIPSGEFLLDQEMIREMNICRSEQAHYREHSGEVMLPFILKYFGPEKKILPISILEQTPSLATELAEKLYQASKKLDKKMLIIASSDFSHFVKPETGFELDNLVLNAMAGFNSQKVYEEVKKHHITVCGFGPIMTLLEYSLLTCQSPKHEILARGNSGKTRISDTVVDYISILFYDEVEATGI